MNSLRTLLLDAARISRQKGYKDRADLYDATKREIERLESLCDSCVQNVQEWAITLSTHRHNDKELHNLLADMGEFILTTENELEYPEREDKSSQGLQDFIRRFGFEPTGEYKKDMETAKILRDKVPCKQD